MSIKSKNRYNGINKSQSREITISLFSGKDIETVVHVEHEKKIAFEELPAYITSQTYSLIRFKNRYRNQKNFDRAGCIALDFDKGLSLEDAIKRLKETKLNAIVGTTRNHQKEKVRKKSGTRVPACDRFRVILGLTRDITSEPDHRATIAALSEIFPELDPSAKDGARYFFPCSKIIFTQFDGKSFEPVKAATLADSPQSAKKNPHESKTYTNVKVFPGINEEAALERALAYLKISSPAIQGEGGDARTLQVANRLMDEGVKSPEECCELMEISGWNDRCDPPWEFVELLQKCKNAAKYRGDPIGSRSPEAIFNDLEGGRKKPTIILKKNQFHDLVVASEKALVEAEAGFYARGPYLVEPVTEVVEASQGRKTTVTRLKEVTPILLRTRLSRVANWSKWDSRAKMNVPADPTKDIAESILQRDGEWSFPSLAGVITCPTLRPDGSLLVTPGYDIQTRLLLVAVPAMPTIPPKPKKIDAVKALAVLEDLLTEFPYVNEASRSVHLSMLITSVVRGALSAAPLHAVRATGAGSGKSYSTDIPSCLVSGQACPVVAAGANEEETEKRLGAIIRTGQPIINIDNVNGELGGAALCQLIERPVVQIRLLGSSETISIENKATVFATGNGIVLTGDMSRRVVLCSLDANLERPELRQFKKDPLEMVLKDRGRYIAAVLIIVRAYIVSGCPEELPALASFGDWSRLVRSALVWLGKADPVETMKAARDEDPQTHQYGQVIAAWIAAIGYDKPITAGELVKWLQREQFPAYQGVSIEKKSESMTDVELLFSALNAVASNRTGKEIDTNRLGKWLSKHRGKIALGVKLVGQLDTHTETNKWSLNQIAPVAGLSRETSKFESKNVTDKIQDRLKKRPAYTGKGGAEKRKPSSSWQKTPTDFF